MMRRKVWSFIFFVTFISLSVCSNYGRVKRDDETSGLLDALNKMFNTDLGTSENSDGDTDSDTVNGDVEDPDPNTSNVESEGTNSVGNVTAETENNEGDGFNTDVANETDSGNNNEDGFNTDTAEETDSGNNNEDGFNTDAAEGINPGNNNEDGFNTDTADENDFGNDLGGVDDDINENNFSVEENTQFENSDNNGAVSDISNSNVIQNSNSNKNSDESSSQSDDYPSSTVSTTPFWYQYDESSEEDYYECFSDTYLDESCSVPEYLEDVRFWEIYSLIFSDTVVDGLYMNCMSGDWCLNSDPGLWYTLIAENAEEFGNANVSAAVCDAATLDCLWKIADNYSNCEDYPRMQLVAKAARLLCQLESDGIRVQNCDIHVMAALHVTMADLERAESAYGSEDEQETELCSTREALMAGTYSCVQSSCDGYLDIIGSFTDWQWFMGDLDMFGQACDFSDSVVCANITVYTETPAPWADDNNTSTEDFSEAMEEFEEMLEEEEENGELEAFSTVPTSSSTIENIEEEFMNAENVQESNNFQPGNENQNPPEESNQELMTDEDMTRKQASGVWVYHSDMRMMVGVALATVMTICGLTILGVMCWRKRLRARSLKSGYEQLLSEENYED